MARGKLQPQQAVDSAGKPVVNASVTLYDPATSGQSNRAAIVWFADDTSTTAIPFRTNASGSLAQANNKPYFTDFTGQFVEDSAGNQLFVAQPLGSGGGTGGAVSSVAGKTGAVALVKADVGLGSVDNTADSSKPVSTAQQAAITSAIAGLIDGAPASLDTLKEITAQLASDESAAAALTNTVATKAPLASPTFTGTVTLPDSTPAAGSLVAVSRKTVDALVASVSGGTPIPDIPYGIQIPGAGQVGDGSSNGVWFLSAAGYVTGGHLDLGSAAGGGAYTVEIFDRSTGNVYLTLIAAAGAVQATVSGRAVQTPANARIGARVTSVGATGTEGSDATVQFSFATTAPTGVTVTQPTVPKPAAATATGSSPSSSTGSISYSIPALLSGQTVQWYRSTASGTKGSALSGATSASGTDATGTAGTGYYYTATVTNSSGSTDSNQVGPLTIPQPVSIVRNSLASGDGVGDGSTNAGSAATFTHAVASGATRLFVLVAGRDIKNGSANTSSPFAVTVNGTAATRVTTGRAPNGSGTSRRVEIWTVVNPTAGANTVSVSQPYTSPGSASGYAFRAVSVDYSGVGSIGSGVNSGLSSADTTVSVATTAAGAAGSKVLSVAAATSTTALTPGSGQTSVANSVFDANAAAEITEKAGGVSPVTVSESWSTADFGAIAALALRV